MPQPFVQVDAFTDRPFAGNPAAVCVLEQPRSEAWQQAVAREMNLSETAFLCRRDEGGFDLRWFTPTVEVDLCGHATLASAHVLWTEGHLAPAETARFHTRSGLLACTLGADGWITMDFPAERVAAIEAPAGLEEALGVGLHFTGRNRMDLLVEVADAATVQGLAPDLGRLAAIEARGVMVTARGGGGGADFVSRFFGPRVGVPEDPVTGSAHCALGPYWSERLGRDRLVGYQASARGGVVRVDVQGPRVRLSGQAVTTIRGEVVPET